ncbi:MAG: translation elongation factor Ts [Actinomycetota bacterium]|jgi:elongation factor Ts|nr:translation elongation factor Ts [Actinomycetota bacterium]MDA8281596.1 translation elongation factor Ts [Actinomycetota bacterium]
MPSFTAKDVQALRQATGAGMMDCKRALVEADGDQESAKRWLREQGLAGAAKRSERDASQGAVALAVTGANAAIVELRCETDFVAKADGFVGLVDELAQLVAAKGEGAAAERADVVDDLKTTLKENISVGRVVRFELGSDSVVGSYLHVQAGRGVNAVLVEMRGGSEELAHDIAVHVAFARPTYLRRDDVPAAEVDEERATVEQISRNEGKPEAALPKIVEGRMNGWFKERCLLEQAYAKDEKRSIAEVIGGAEVLRFAQVVIGA